MRIVTFNIHHATVGSDGPVDPERLGRVCAAFKADVLALQEVDRGTWRTGGSDAAAVVARACGMDHVFGPSRRFPGGWYGNALLVRGEIRRWSVAALPRVPRWRRWQERRTVLEAWVVVDGRPLFVAATHLAVPQHVNGPQLDVVLERASARLRSGGAPVVVLGDLNRFPSTVRPSAEAVGLRYVPHGPTCPVPPGISIDHVLIGPGLRVTAKEVRSTEMSDHAALVVDVAVADPA